MEQYDNFNKVDGDLFAQFFSAIDRAKKLEKLKTAAKELSSDDLREIADSMDEAKEAALHSEISALMEWARDSFIPAMDKAGYEEFEFSVKDGELAYMLIKGDE